MTRLLAILVTALVTGCAPGLSRVTWPDRQPIARDSLHTLTGVYSYVGEAQLCTTATGAHCPTGFLDAISGYRTSRALNEADASTMFALRLRPPDEWVVTVFSDERVLHESTLTGDVSPDGYFITSRTRPSLASVPVAWTLERDVVRLGRSSEGTLLVERERSGLLFLVAFPFFAFNDHTRYTFARISERSDPAGVQPPNEPGE